MRSLRPLLLIGLTFASLEFSYSQDKPVKIVSEQNLGTPNEDAERDACEGFDILFAAGQLTGDRDSRGKSRVLKLRNYCSRKRPSPSDTAQKGRS